VRGDAGQVSPADGVLDDDQRVNAPQQHGVHAEPVARLVSDPADLAARRGVLVPPYQELGVLGRSGQAQSSNRAPQVLRHDEANALL
jgi:hypothetical protein